MIDHVQPAGAAGPPQVSRRWFLAGAAALVVGAGGGVAAQVLHRPAHHAKPARPPASLVAALAAEDALIRDLDATTGGSPAVRVTIAQLRADHTAHADALRALLATYPKAAASPSPASSATGSPRTRAQLRAAEQQAAASGGARASVAHGELAALLASIAACEATHAHLLA